MSNVVVTARISAELSESLELLGRDLDRPRSWLVARAIERYVEEEAELIAAIRQGEEDVAAGRLHSQAEVETMFDVRRDRRDAA